MAGTSSPRISCHESMDVYIPPEDHPLVMFGRRACIRCIRAKDQLWGVRPVVYIDLDGQPGLGQQIATLSGITVLPILLEEGHWLSAEDLNLV